MEIMREILFVLLIFSPFAVAIPLAISCRRRGEHARILPGLIVTLLAILTVYFFSPFDYNPAWFLIGLSTAISLGIYEAFALVHSPIIRSVSYFGIIICGVVAVGFLMFISSGYNTGRTKAQNTYRESIAVGLKHDLLAAAPEQTFPAGNITAGSPILAVLPASSRNHIEKQQARYGYNFTRVRRWHTPLTGLYRTDRTPMQLWYPGGKVKDVASMIVWR